MDGTTHVLFIIDSLIFLRFDNIYKRVLRVDHENSHSVWLHLIVMSAKFNGYENLSPMPWASENSHWSLDICTMCVWVKH